MCTIQETNYATYVRTNSIATSELGGWWGPKAALVRPGSLLYRLFRRFKQKLAQAKLPLFNNDKDDERNEIAHMVVTDAQHQYHKASLKAANNVKQELTFVLTPTGGVRIPFRIRLPHLGAPSFRLLVVPEGKTMHVPSVLTALKATLVDLYQHPWSADDTMSTDTEMKSLVDTGKMPSASTKQEVLIRLKSRRQQFIDSSSSSTVAVANPTTTTTTTTNKRKATQQIQPIEESDDDDDDDDGVQEQAVAEAVVKRDEIVSSRQTHGKRVASVRARNLLSIHAREEPDQEEEKDEDKDHEKEEEEDEKEDEDENEDEDYVGEEDEEDDDVDVEEEEEEEEEEPEVEEIRNGKDEVGNQSNDIDIDEEEGEEEETNHNSDDEETALTRLSTISQSMETVQQLMAKEINKSMKAMKTLAQSQKQMNEYAAYIRAVVGTSGPIKSAIKRQRRA